MAGVNICSASLLVLTTPTPPPFLKGGLLITDMPASMYRTLLDNAIFARVMLNGTSSPLLFITTIPSIADAFGEPMVLAGQAANAKFFTAGGMLVSTRAEFPGLTYPSAAYLWTWTFPVPSAGSSTLLGDIRLFTDFRNNILAFIKEF